MNLRLINQLKAIAARWGAGPAVAPVSASRILDTLMAASGASLTPGRVASFDHKLDALIASLGLTVTQPAGRFKKLAVVAGVEELLGSYDPRTVFGSDLVTWYGNSVDELWAEHRTCWEDSPELVVNGDFSAGLTGWTPRPQVSQSIVAGRLRLEALVAGEAFSAQTIEGLIPGRYYRIEIALESAAANSAVRARLRVSPYGSSLDIQADAAGVVKRASIGFTATATSCVLQLGVAATAAWGAIGDVAFFDNISVREIDFSKSRLFSDNFITPPVTGLEQTVGLILDKSKGLELGPEKFSGFATLGPGWVVEADGSWSCVNTSGASSDARVDLPNTPGVWNRIAFTVLENTLASNALYPMNTSPLTLGVIPGNREFISSPLGDFGTTRFLLFRVGPGSTLRISGISVRELPGHHLSQPTATARGRLSARYNEVGQNVNLMVMPWTLDRAVRTVSLDQPPPGYGQAIKLAANTENNGHFLRSTTGTAGRYFGVLAKAAEYSFMSIRPAGLGGFMVCWNIATGTLVSAGANVAAHGIEPVGDGWYWCWMEIGQASSPTADMRIHVETNGSLASYVGDNTSGILIASPDRRVTRYPFVPLHQRVNSASDYDTVGFPARLATDGVDDRWVTGNINMTGVAGFSVWASALRVGSTDRRVLAAFGDAISDVVGFNLESADTGQTPPGFGLRVRTGGTGQLSVQPSVLGTPYAVYAEWDAGTQIGSSRLNGITAGPTPTSSGTAGLGSLQFAVGGRIGGTNGWNGDIFSLPMIVRRLATPEEITAAESAFGRTIGVLQ